MKVIAVLLFLASAFSSDILRAGIMYISKLDDRPTHQNLITDGFKLVVAEEGSRFDYDKRGTLKLTGTTQYLNVNGRGQIVLDDQAQTGFVMSPQAGSRSRKSISYRGQSVFELCEDDSVALDSNCSEGRRVLITFEDINRSY